MKRLLRRLIPATAVAFLLAPAASAPAAFHLIKIVEVSPGAHWAPSLDYVVLQMWSGGQTALTGHGITVYDADGTEIDTITFSSADAAGLTNGANQARILIATTQAETFYSLQADLEMPPILDAAGGKVCFDGSPDCFSWGAYTGPSSGSGTPFPSNPETVGDFESPGYERVAKRRLDISGSPTILEPGDDTDNSAGDFVFGTPSPVNNTPQAGTNPAADRLGFQMPMFTVAEDAGTATITVSHIGTTSVGYTHTASDGSADVADYSGGDVSDTSPGTMTSPFETSRTVPITIADDEDVEGPETVALSLADPPPTTSLIPDPTATLTILDDDVPPDADAPTTSITKPVNGKEYAADKIRALRGIAADLGPSGLNLVEVALLQKRRGGVCKWWDGDAFETGDCATKVFRPATGTANWSYDLPSPLRQSTSGKVKNYTLYARATDLAANVEDEFTPGRNFNKFEVK